MLTMFSGTKITALPPGVNPASSPSQLRARGTPSSSTPKADSTSTSDYCEERRHIHHEADIVIVGAGVVGCAAAVAFGKQGRSVILLEKSLKEPDRIVGELLQPGGVNALEKLGMKDCLDGIDAIPCYGYQVSYYREPVHIPYPNNLVTSSPSKTPEGRSFHHGRFISKLRAKARATPNVTIVETTVTRVVKSDYTGQVVGVACQTEGKQDYYFGAVTLVADGYASKFRKDYLPHQPQVRSKFYALEMIDAELPMPNHGHVVLSDAPPILIYQIGTHETRVLVDVPENLPSASVKAGGIKNHLLNVALPNLPECAQPAFRRAVEDGKLRSMPNSFLPPASQKTPGLIMLGDAMNMRHPLTGGGMTVAFNDVVTMSNLLSPELVPNLEDTEAVLKALSQFHWSRKSGSSVINILAMALYSLFAANNPYLTSLKNGCFRYFQLGGLHVSEPCGMLSGLVANPWTLVYHFFSVALYAIWCRLCEVPIWQAPYVMIVESTMIIWTAARVIGPYLVWEVRR
ncbi:SE-domain-containing protein [Cucurbitaria berberidis CBS 394.84]|uniref:Squalene monooxygenase n=1 Tax=Cucurbitaria berberidis CBS 394.84 TaxID=1168544 RepID=A0A9P4LA10_9PLEO|nr:SE-domain-containing protein [Cucurbitaria berberidis CBS 394.84]KAF1847595.1 SE-domain-containing protein [Cucurbitaria berberidis CBS 394.84]